MWQNTALTLKFECRRSKGELMRHISKLSADGNLHANLQFLIYANLLIILHSLCTLCKATFKFNSHQHADAKMAWTRMGAVMPLTKLLKQWWATFSPLEAEERVVIFVAGGTHNHNNVHIIFIPLVAWRSTLELLVMRAVGCPPLHLRHYQ